MSFFRMLSSSGKSAVAATAAAACPAPAPATSPLRSVKFRSDKWSNASATQRMRILSLDGGGVRGTMTAVILRRIEAAVPGFIARHVDMIAGTSTGGLLALLLASGYTPKDCERIYKSWVPRIFAPEYLRLYNFENAKYDSKIKREACEYYLGDRTLGDLEKIVLIPAFRLNGSSEDCAFFGNRHWRPALLSNLPRADGMIPPDSHASAVDVAMRTSAAPTMFPVHQGYVDGGINANNPSLFAIARVFDNYKHLKRNHLSVLSIGAGVFDKYTDTDPEEDDWGIRPWGRVLPELFLQSQSCASELTLTMLMGDRYHRCDIELEEDIPLDGVAHMSNMIAMAEKVDLGPTMAFIEKNFSSSAPSS